MKRREDAVNGHPGQVIGERRVRRGARFISLITSKPFSTHRIWPRSRTSDDTGATVHRERIAVC
ncbi:MAG TPA: hypothetical protein VK475_10560 [Pyrinomonadaceae bacterium]|nr:hypothetical protein [Pyrinomonadaceae bacterium]